MVQQSIEFTPLLWNIGPHTYDDGSCVPNSIAIHVVGWVSVAIAVNGKIVVVGILDEGFKRTARVLNDLVDGLLIRNCIAPASGDILTIESYREASINAMDTCLLYTSPSPRDRG